MAWGQRAVGEALADQVARSVEGRVGPGERSRLPGCDLEWSRWWKARRRQLGGQEGGAGWLVRSEVKSCVVVLVEVF